MSEDWEKDFDLDMTEEEVQLALSKIDASGEVGCLFCDVKPKFQMNVKIGGNVTEHFLLSFSSWMKTGRTGTESHRSTNSVSP